jgi:hypothetical protein
MPWGLQRVRSPDFRLEVFLERAMKRLSQKSKVAVRMNPFLAELLRIAL